MLEQLGMVVANMKGLHRIDECGLKRAEFVIIDEKLRGAVLDFINNRRLPFSAHLPMFIPADFPENPLLASLLDFDENRRLHALGMIEKTISEASEMGAQYVVMHIQRPEHFGGKNPPGVSSQEAFSIVSRSCEKVAELSEKFGMQVLLENQMDNSGFNHSDLYVKLFDAFPTLKFCLDIGHLDVDARQFGIPFHDFIDALLPYLRAVHLMNSNSGKLDFTDRHWKIPVHPDQKESDGWRNIEFIIRKILSYDSSIIINFESRPDEKYNVEYMLAGISWIKELIIRILEEKKNE